jgi:hypothetical protein
MRGGPSIDRANVRSRLELILVAMARAVINCQPAFSVSMDGEQSPILFASHHPPRRASSITRCPPQCLRSGEYEIQI